MKNSLVKQIEMVFKGDIDELKHLSIKRLKVRKRKVNEIERVIYDNLMNQNIDLGFLYKSIKQHLHSPGFM